MNKDEKDFGAVGNIRIKEPKKKKNKKNNDGPSLGIKIFIWFMFFAMVIGFVAPLAVQLLNVISRNS